MEENREDLTAPENQGNDPADHAEGAGSVSDAFREALEKMTSEAAGGGEGGESAADALAAAAAALSGSVAAPEAAAEEVPAESEPEPAPSPVASSSEAEAEAEAAEPEVDAEPAASSEAEAEPEAPKKAEAQWFAIRVQSNKEDSVKRNLETKIKLRGLGRKIVQVVVPTEKVAEIKNGRKRTRQVKTYPGYVLLEMFMDDETWSFVRDTPGVGDFVGGGGSAHQKPFPLLPEEVSKIFGHDLPAESAPKIKIDFSVGDKVKIREGPFENFDGVVEEINEQKGLVRVVVTIFGRSTPVELQYWQVEPI